MKHYQTKLDVFNLCYFMNCDQIQEGEVREIDIHVNTNSQVIISYTVRTKTAEVNILEQSVFATIDELLENLKGEFYGRTKKIKV